MSKSILVSGASGLGDSVYLYAIAKYLIYHQGEPEVVVRTKWPTLFKPLPVKTVNLSITPENVKGQYRVIQCRYWERKGNQETSQWQDSLILANLNEADVPFEFDSINTGKFEIKLKDKKLCLIKNPYVSFKESSELSWDINILRRIIKEFKNEYFFVLVGHGNSEQKVEIEGIDLDLINQTSVQDLSFLVKQSDMIITRTGHLVPMAEAQGRRCFVIFSQRGLNSQEKIVRQITPQKVISRPELAYSVVDSQPISEIIQAFRKCQGVKVGARKSLSKYPFAPKKMMSKEEVRDIFKGKRVVILGSAPSVLENKRSEIDSYDVIVRMNNYDLSKYADRIGSRTDVYFFFGGTSVRKTWESLRDDGAKYLYSRLPYCDFRNHNAGKIQLGISGNWMSFFQKEWFWTRLPTYIVSRDDFIRNFKILNRILTTGMSAVVDIARYAPKELYVTGFDFFDSGIHEIDVPWKQGCGGHDVGRERYLMRWIALENPNIRMDVRLRQACGIDKWRFD